MVSAIGIKIANGEFYPILEENAPVKKRLVLTTVHDNQQSVHIDLYKSDTATMQNALYIGSLFIDHLKPAPKGEPSIEIVVTSNGYGEIAADVVDLDSASETRHLQVSLNAPVDLPSAMGADFEVEDVMPDLSPPAGLYDFDTKKKFPWLIALALLIGVLIILFLLWFFLLRGKGNRETPPDVLSAVESPQPEPTPLVAIVPSSPVLTPEPESVVEPEPLGDSVVESEPVAESEPLATDSAEPEAVTESEPLSTDSAEPEPFMPIEEVTEEPKQAVAVVPLIEAPVQAPEPPLEEVTRSRPSPPVASYKVPTTIPPSGAPYRIRWGDTLWDISEAFYRNPWLYPRIARFNNIRNPNLIVSGTTIRVPPR